MVTPNTIVKLYSGIPCDPTYQNVLHFDSVAEQNAYFANKIPVATYTDFQFLDGNRELRVKRNMENCYNINYVAYQNHRFGNKWFYAFVKSMEYASPESTKLFLEEDVWATWQFDLTFNTSFVERETVSNDTIGAHTLPENVEIGPYITTAHSYTRFDNMHIIMLLSDMSEYVQKELGEAIVSVINAPAVVNGTPVPVYWVDCGKVSDGDTAMAKIRTIVDAYSKVGQANAVVGVYCAPKLGNTWGSASPPNALAAYPDRTLSFIPKNNKLYTYPYCALNVLTAGGGVTYRYELCENGGEGGNLKLTEPFGISPTLSVTMENYAGNNFDIQNQLAVSGFPILAWTNNAYQDWVARNKASIATGVVGGLGAMIGGAITANPAAIVGGAAAVAGIVARTEQAKLMPDEMRGSAKAQDANAVSGHLGVYANCVCVRPEYGKVIDNYFSQYGYRVATAKEIELHSRQNWNFVKTISANITGNCPAPVIERIKTMFDSGITLWHTGNFDYGDLSNPII